MKRLVDIIFVIFTLILTSLPMALISILIFTTSKGGVLHWSKRVGLDNKIFEMPKFRTMRLGTPEVATHILVDPKNWLTPVGSFLRKTSLDELPQLWSILIGDMSFVGPRPALYNQEDLIVLRTKYGIHKILPGLSGWAQVNGRDKLSISDKAAFDYYYLKNKSFLLDIKILWTTFKNVAFTNDVSH